MENHCEECGLHKLCNKPRIRARGNIDNPKLIVIGEAPGRTEDEEGKVFIGRSGNLLSEVLGEDEDLVYITNTVKCCPYLDPFVPDRGTRNPSEEEIEFCKPFLLKELDLFNPSETAILTLGNSPLTSLVGKHKGITKEAGAVRFVKIGEQMWKIFPNYHPSYILRGKLGSSTDEEFRDIVKQALNHDQDIDEDDDLYMIATPSEAIREAKLVVEAYNDGVIDYVVYDCETSGFLPWKHKIIMYSFYAKEVNTNNKSISVPIHITNINHHPDTYPYRVRPIDFDLSAKDIAMINRAIGEMLKVVPIVGHNLKFDIQFAVSHSLCRFEDIQVHYDTLLMAHIVLGRQFFGALDLKTLVTKMFRGVKNWELPIDTYRGLFRKIEDRSYDKIPTSILGKYAALDTYYNEALFTALFERMMNESQ